MGFDRKRIRRTTSDLAGLEDAAVRGAGLTGSSREKHLLLERISLAIDQLAPTPGARVYVHAEPLRRWANGLEPVVFTAMDACTHLQVAHAYLVVTRAAALTFMEFATASFPFRISRITTPRQEPIYDDATGGAVGAFSSMMMDHGIFHRMVDDPSSDPLLSIARRLAFGAADDAIDGRNLQGTLARFLYAHNTCRPIEWLGERTPLQKLRSFREFKDIHEFDPFSPVGEPLEGHAPRNGATNGGHGVPIQRKESTT